VLVIYKKRPNSYDWDWLEAFVKAGFTTAHEQTAFHDLTVILHSVSAQFYGMPQWITEEAQKRQGGKLVVFLGNEFKKLKEKSDWARELGADVIATQVPSEYIGKHYALPVIDVPHALNPDVFVPGVKTKDMGFRGNKYPPAGEIGDEERNRICNPGLWSGLDHDIVCGYESMLDRDGWAAALAGWKSMPTCEGGMVGLKCITSRHFEAIGAHACLVSYPGHYNGILKPEHYITLDRNHANLAEVKERVLSDSQRIVTAAREYLCDEHTHRHRVKQVLDWAGA
jgi:hypothetical protein